MLALILAVPFNMTLLNVRWPTSEQVDALEACLIRVLARILEQKGMKFATHVIDGPG